MSNGIFNTIKGLFGLPVIDDDFYDELEESLIYADIGVATTEKLIDFLKSKQKEGVVKTPDECRNYLIDFLKNEMANAPDAFEFENKKSVLLIVGVNGVGKTSSAGKLAGYYKSKGKKVILAAADTFRAGATEQLVIWAERSGVRIVAQGDGADPAAIIYDSIKAADSSNADILICDTAGRLHNKKNLMDELTKIYKVIQREASDYVVETLLVLDATTGQNAIAQAKEFTSVTDLSGIILTKMDSSSKGGIAIAIESELNIPVKFIGTGEGLNDIEIFNSEKYVSGLFE